MEKFNVFHNAIQGYIPNYTLQHISIDHIFSEVAKKVVSLSTDLIEIFLTYLPHEHTNLFFLALSRNQPKDNQKLITAARLAWLIPANDHEKKANACDGKNKRLTFLLPSNVPKTKHFLTGFRSNLLPPNER